MEGVRERPKKRYCRLQRSLAGTRQKSKKGRREERERLALINNEKEDNHLEIYRGVAGRYWNENVSARPDGQREKKAEIAILCM